jgi:Putative polyhydroxyalkanoic acid system protein (PHA_gran_rgn)
MSQPLIVTIPHKLGKEEAVRRLKSGLAGVHKNFGGVFALTEQSWSADRLQFAARALGQTAAGAIDVADDHVRIELDLPWMLARLARNAQALIRRQGQLMLEKK